MDSVPLLPSAFLNIFALSLIAGLGTGLGGVIAVLCIPGRRTFGFLMGITAGVMITLSFLELVNKAWEQAGYLTATIGFAAGAFFMFGLDFFAPHIRFGEAEIRSPETPPLTDAPGALLPFRFRLWPRGGQNHITNHRLLRTGIFLAIGITIHNIPEGIAVGAGYMHAPAFGLFITIAILLHNIPEGIATALPLRQSGVCRWDAFRVSLLSGLTEPIGALIAGLFLASFDLFVPAALAFAGGVMMFITLDELIPTAREHGHEHATALGIIFGAIFIFLLSGIFGL